MSFEKDTPKTVSDASAASLTLQASDLKSCPFSGKTLVVISLSETHLSRLRELYPSLAHDSYLPFTIRLEYPQGGIIIEPLSNMSVGHWNSLYQKWVASQSDAI